MGFSADTSAARRGVQTLQAGITQAAALALRAAIEAGTKDAKGTTKFQDRTGGTRQSTHGEYLPGLQGFIEAGGAAGFLENGTPPHFIGSSVLIQGVGWRFIGQHPGTQPRPFMREARNLAENIAEYRAETFVDEAIRRV